MSDQQGRTFSDDELLGLFNSDEDLSLLSPAEQSRMLKLTDKKPEPAAPPKDTSNDSWTDYLPMAGGAAVGLLGGAKTNPVGIALSGLGGAAGEAAKQVADVLRGDMSDVPSPGLPQLKKIASEGLKQAGYEGVGRGVGAVVRPVAKAVYLSALRPSLAAARDLGGNALKGFNRIANQGLDDMILPNAMGASRAETLTRASRAAADQIAEAGPRIPNRQLVPTSRILQEAEADQLTRMASEAKSAGVRPRPEVVQQQLGRMKAANPLKVTTAQLQNIRREAGKIADPVFAAAKGVGGSGRVPLGTEPSVAHSVATASANTLNKLLGPAFTKANQTTQTRRAVEEAAKAAAARPNTLQNTVAGGFGLHGLMSGDPGAALLNYLLSRGLTSPTARAGLGIGLAKTPYSQVLRGADTLGAGVGDELLALLGQRSSPE